MGKWRKRRGGGGGGLSVETQGIWKRCQIWYTVNVEIFAQYMFSGILRSAVDARKYGVRENSNYIRTKRIIDYLREVLIARICLRKVGVRKFNSAKISTFTVPKL